MACFNKIFSRKIFFNAVVFAFFCGAIFAEGQLFPEVRNFWNGEKEPIFTLEDKVEVSKAELMAGDAEKDVSFSKVKEIVQSLQKMQGIQYYSNGDKKWETLYHKCYFVGSLDSKNIVEMKIDENVDGKNAYFYQNDNSFGDCFYKVSYREVENEIALFLDLADYIKYGPIKAIKPGELKIAFYVTDLQDRYEVYIFTQARFSQIGVLEKRIGKSISNRVEAIRKWFLAEF